MNAPEEDVAFDIALALPPEGELAGFVVRRSYGPILPFGESLGLEAHRPGDGARLSIDALVFPEAQAALNTGPFFLSNRINEVLGTLSGRAIGEEARYMDTLVLITHPGPPRGGYILGARDGLSCVRVQLRLQVLQDEHGQPLKDENNCEAYPELSAPEVELVEEVALRCLGRLATLGCTRGVAPPVPIPQHLRDALRAWQSSRKTAFGVPSAMPKPGDLSGWIVDEAKHTWLEAMRQADGARLSLSVNVAPNEEQAPQQLEQSTHGRMERDLAVSGEIEAWRPGPSPLNPSLPNSQVLLREGRFIIRAGLSLPRREVPWQHEDRAAPTEEPVYTDSDRRFIEEQAALCRRRLSAMGLDARARAWWY